MLRASSSADNTAAAQSAKALIGVNMTTFLSQQGVDPSLILLFNALQSASKRVASKIARASIEGILGEVSAGVTVASVDRDAQKKLDVVAVSMY